MLLTLILGSITAISLSYFNNTKLEFWKRILIILLVFNVILLVEGASTTTINSSWANLVQLNCRSFVFLSLMFLTVLGVLLLPFNSTSTTGQTERYIFILTIIFGGTLLITSVDLLTIFLGLELQSYSVYLLAASYKNLEPSESAGLKYFLLGALSSTFILMGFILLYIYSGTSNLIYSLVVVSDSQIYSLPGDTTTSDIARSALPYVGILLIFIGISWKLAAAPFHAWSIDVYDAVPGTLTAILSLLPKIGLFSFLITLLEQLQVSGTLYVEQSSKTIVNLASSFVQIVGLIIILSFLLGSVLGLRQSRIKRLLAYSSVLNVGFIFMSAVISTSQINVTSVFYVAQYILTTVAVWICITNLANGQEITLTSQLQGVYGSNKLVQSSDSKSRFSNTVIAVCLSLLILSTAGIPPMAGFFAKYDVILLSVESGYFSLAFAAILASLISTVYYLNIVQRVWFKAPTLIPVIYSNSQTNLAINDLSNKIRVPQIADSSTNQTSQGKYQILIFLTLIIGLYTIESGVLTTFMSLSS